MTEDEAIALGRMIFHRITDGNMAYGSTMIADAVRYHVSVAYREAAQMLEAERATLGASQRDWPVANALDAVINRVRHKVNEAPAPPDDTDEWTIPNLVMFISRMARRLRKFETDHASTKSALDFIERKGLRGSMLR